MNKKRGFTLTEVLLAVLLVALIGISLASLTTAASRESGIGRSRVMLRNSMSRALRQLRQDVHESSRILYARNRISSVTDTDAIPLLLLGQNIQLDGTAIAGMTARYVLYCFRSGSRTTTANGSNVEPTAARLGSSQSARDDGIIYRKVLTTLSSVSPVNPSCSENTTDSDIFLENVKFIPPASSTTSEYYYPVPLFAKVGQVNTSTAYQEYLDGSNVATIDGRLKINFILELASTPVVNEAADEEFVLPIGYAQ